jgi:hypothetical protein
VFDRLVTEQGSVLWIHPGCFLPKGASAGAVARKIIRKVPFCALRAQNKRILSPPGLRVCLLVSDVSARSTSKGLPIEAQPDSTTCGPTCLHAVYRHFGLELPLGQIIDEIQRLDHGGTLDVFLANHALVQGFRATIHTYNLTVFDPTWFDAPRTDLSRVLIRQRDAKNRESLTIATNGYLEFLQRGGAIEFFDLSRRLLRELLQAGHPILTGLSATYLYRSAREYGPDDEDDDIRGEPVGHFVLLTAFEEATDSVLISDPMHDNPRGKQNYRVHVDRLIGSILLGALTFDANLLIIEPGDAMLKRRGAEQCAS